MKVYGLATFGAGTHHIVSDKGLAQRWKESNKWRIAIEFEVDHDLEEVERLIQQEKDRAAKNQAA